MRHGTAMLNAGLQPPEGNNAWFRKLAEPGTLIALLAALGGWGAWSVEHYVATAQLELRVARLETNSSSLSNQVSAIATQLAGVNPRLDGISDMLKVISANQDRRLDNLQQQIEHR